MKILVVSLLRLGDLVQQNALLESLRSQYPEAELHLLINREFAQAREILTSVDRYHYFDRQALQKGLGEAEYNIFWSFYKLQDLVAELNQEGYDRVYNFTHTRLSAYLIGTLNIPEKRGLFYQQGRFAGLQSPWIKYFNDRFAGAGKSVFNYVELLARSFDLPSPQARPSSGSRLARRILFQPLTSDSKKNWGLKNFVELKELIESQTEYQVKVMGAEFERTTLEKFFEPQDLLICNLRQARELLREARLLVTGDTSIKHLAVLVGTPLVELVLGSSDFKKTGAFSPNARPVISTSPCFPCSHSSPCSQESHLCAEELSVGRVWNEIYNELHGMVRDSAEDSVLQIEQQVWRHFLNGTKPALNAEASSPPPGSAQINQALQNFLQAIEDHLPPRSFFASRSSLRTEEVEGLVKVAHQILTSPQDKGGYFQKFIEALVARHPQAIDFYNAIERALDEARALICLREQVTFKSISREGEGNAKEIGQLSEDITAKAGEGL